jgi:hypothetical protein
VLGGGATLIGEGFGFDVGAEPLPSGGGELCAVDVRSVLADGAVNFGFATGFDTGRGSLRVAGA